MMTHHRPFSGFALTIVASLALAACGGDGAGGTGGGGQEQAPAKVLEKRDDLITLPCGLHGKDVLSGKCWLEWLPAKAGEERPFLIHQADGGFRRFAISADGNRVDIADGAEPFVVTEQTSDMLTFRVGRDAYRLSIATLKR
ncbi:hypothetical protein GGR43_001115 [Sphingobium jiangsuense]|uniref:Lipoprotein n=1 Tax=Sphingobium jiangsuense TaxID=870476 RepID=A0A7W6BKR8_9SPHN|nr:hypothetical protein [Sphingobium jiangsuense]MBB3925402.1 hypothetical protein [Sphingobium jiangsuense]